MGPINVLYVLDKLTVGESHLHGVTRLCGWWIPEFDRAAFNVSAATLRGRDDPWLVAYVAGFTVPYVVLLAKGQRS